jgi:alpha-1,3-rhamnosyl/mannosyltransferase
MGIGPNFRIHSESELSETRSRLGLPARYLLYVGTVEPRKNLATLLTAYCDLSAELRDACPLVLGGSWGWKSEQVRELFESQARHRGVRYLGYVADEDLPPLYGGAVALLYPSFYEGFGLPPLEAMACGTAAIVSTANAVKEVVGTNAVQIDPNDITAWREAMRCAIADKEYLESYRKAGVQHAARFKWEQAAQTTLCVYRRVLGISQECNSKDLSSRAA